jgi:hypothetical protein
MDSSAPQGPSLAPAYELALELERQGLSNEALAERLGVPDAALDSLLDIAHAKAGSAREAASRPDPEGD